MRSPLLPIFLIVVVDVLGLTIMLPLLPFYAEHFGATPAVVGLLVSTYALCQLVAGPVLGQMSDRLGRKPVLMASQIGTFVGFLVLAFAPSLFVVFLARAGEHYRIRRMAEPRILVSRADLPAEPEILALPGR